MKKYIAIVVCAILSIAALVLPIGTDARSNGKGSGSSTSIKDVSQLNTLLENADNGGVATYSYNYSEGLDIDRYSLNIVNAQMNVEQGSTDNEFDAKEGYINVFTDKVHPHTGLPYSTRVTNLHTSATSSKGKFVTDFDFVTFVDLDMNTGMVKVAYQQDGETWFEGDEEIGNAYCSGSDLGLDMQEATASIKVYSDETLTTVKKTIKKTQLFALIGVDGDIAHIKYSNGKGFVDGYISSTKYRSAYVMVKHNDNVNDSLTRIWGEIPSGTPDRKAYNDAKWEIYTTKYLGKDGKTTKTTYRQGQIIRYYGNENFTYLNKFYRVAKIGHVVDGELKIGYIDSAMLMKLEISQLSKVDTINSHNGSAKMYVTSDAVYTTLQIHSTIATGTIAKRTYVDAELYVSGKTQLIKFNSIIYQDESLGVTQEDFDFVAALPIREWMTMKDACIYLDADKAATATYVSPLNELITSQVDEDGCLSWVSFLAQSVTTETLVSNGKTASLKTDYASAYNDAFYKQVNGEKYEPFKPSEDAEHTMSSQLDVSFKKSKNPTIKASYSYSVPVGDIYINNTSRFEGSADRQVEISNVGTTIVPAIVMAEINAFARG